MINEQKAKELCGACPNCTFSCGDRLNCKVEDKYNIAMKMAEWKDEQFSKFLLWLDDHYVIRRFTDGEPMTYAELIDNFKSNSYEHNATKTD